MGELFDVEGRHECDPPSWVPGERSPNLGAIWRCECGKFWEYRQPVLVGGYAPPQW